MVNFIGPLIILTGLLSLIGIITGLVMKNIRILLVTLVVFSLISIILILDIILFE